jgi:predicted HTH domain antitoxin
VRSALQAVRKAELEVRDHMDALEQRSADDDPFELARELVLSSALPLEMTLFAACLGELAAERGAKRLGDLDPHRQEVWDELRRRMRIGDLAAVLAEHLPTLMQLSGLTGDELEATELQPVPPMPMVLRQANAVLAACPITTIERAAEVAHLPEYGHRCRVAYDGLRAFLRRAESEGPLDEVGAVYATGAISITQASKILGVHPSDALAELEERGHCRSPDALALSAEDEAALFRRIRADREQRGGAPAFSAERVAREAIASERIEGVDARQWLRG